MKKLIYIIFFAAFLGVSQSHPETNTVGSHQDVSAGPRIEVIASQLKELSATNPGLTEQARTEISVSNITLSNLILAISKAHDININIAPELDQISIANNHFSDAIVSDLLVFLCKEYDLSIDFTGSILSIKKYVPKEVPEVRIIPVSYHPENNSISIDAKNGQLFEVFKRIMDESAKNLVFAPGLENKTLNFYVKDCPFDAAMDKLALANNLNVEKTKDHFYVFEDVSTSANSNRLQRRLKNGQQEIFRVLDLKRQLLEVNFNNTPIADIINDLGEALDLDVFTATPLEHAGSVTFKAKSIGFDELLTKIFESGLAGGNTAPGAETQDRDTKKNGNPTVSNANQAFTFKKEGNVYFFGTEDQLSVRKVEIIPLMHRSVELLSDPSGGSGRSRTVGRSYGSGYNNYSNYNSYSGYNQNRNLGSNYNHSSYNNSAINRNTTQSGVSNSGNRTTNGPSQTIEAIVPQDIVNGLEIKIDHELNSLYVTGASTKIDRLKAFINYIDKPVPVVLIEVMFVEVGRNNTIETGVSWGIGDGPVETKGNLFPTTDFTLGAKTINRVINGFDGFDRLNLGKVVPNFFATVKAMESNGHLKIKSTPKLSTLNGHRATFSNGETSYYTVTQRNIYGTDNPQTSEITNYEPIDAELGLTIKPLVSGDGQVTLDIFVIQSSFGNRIDENAPPDISSREFSSIIRVQDQDIVVLGGLEEQMKKNSGSGVPFLARVPVLKWLFSSRKREASKAKLTVFIKPTIIY